MSFAAAAPAAAEAAGSAAGLGEAAGAAGSTLGAAGGGMAATAAPAFGAGGFGLGLEGMAGNGAGMMSAMNTASPSFMDGAMGMLKRFRAGGDQSLGDAIKNFGANPETYGYMAGKIGELIQGHKTSAPPAPVVYPTYQQPENTYLKRRGY